MIVIGEENLTKQIRDLWKDNYSEMDPKYIDFVFRNIYQPEYLYCDKEGDQVRASLLRIPHAMMFNDRVLACSYITGITERAEGQAEQELIPTVIDACENSELITLASVRNAGYLAKYGFEKIYSRCDYLLQKKDFKPITNFGCAYDPSPLDMLKIYSVFVRRFNGFSARHVEDFVNLKKEAAARGGKVVAYYDEKNRICAYAVIIVTPDDAIIEECIYLDASGLMKMLNAAFQERSLVHLVVSEAENLRPLFPKAARNVLWTTMARLNDADLFSRLFSIPAANVKEAYEISKKPLFYNERF